MSKTGQCVAVFGCHNSNKTLLVENVIKGILEKDELKASHKKKELFSSYTWNITNKYYAAAVDIYHIKEKNIVGKDFSSEVEAVIAVFDSKKKAKCIANLESWLSYVDVWDPEIKLAVCERCSSVDDKENKFINREEILGWCIDHEFELVELDPIPDDYAEDEDFGYKRIRSALSAHMWPNMEMKSPEETGKSTSKENKVETKEAIKEEPAPALPSVEERLDALLLDENLDGDDMEENFEALFQKLKVFKETAAGKSGSSRMDYAEQVVTAFWRAIGGDEEELKGQLSDEV